MPQLKRNVLLKTTGVFGILTPIISILFIAFAIIFSPWFNWFNNALSDLGVHEAATIFNSGLILGGILATIFAIGLIMILKKQMLGLLGAFIFFLSAISLIAIGLFPESTGRIHLYVSITFFSLLAISLLLLGGAIIIESSQRYLGLFTILVGVVAAATWVVPHKGAAIPEIISGLAASTWTIVLGVELLRLHDISKLRKS